MRRQCGSIKLIAKGKWLQVGDSLNEKKWFVYMADHHEGPFSAVEIAEKVKGNKISSEQYIWTEGMADWEMLASVEEIQIALPSNESEPDITEVTDTNASAEDDAEKTGESNLLNPVENSDLAPTPSEDILEELSNIEMESVANQNDAMNIDHEVEAHLELGEDIDQAIGQAEAEIPPSQSNEKKDKKKKEKKAKLKMSIRLPLIPVKKVGILLALAMVLAGAYVFFGKKSVTFNLDQNILAKLQKLPLISKFLITIPKVPGASELELTRIKEIVRLDPVSDQIDGEIIVRQVEGPRPEVILVTNLPDGAGFNLFLEGVPGTLVNVDNFTLVKKMTVKGHLANSGVLRKKDGGPIPQGWYRLYIFNFGLKKQPVEIQEILKGKSVQPQANWTSKLPKNLAVVFQRRVFLSGKEDQVYKRRLLEYEEKINNQKKSTLVQLKMFASTLESQFRELMTEYNRIKKIKNRKKKISEWNLFSKRWQGLTSSLTKEFSGWDRAYIEKVNLYRRVHFMVRESGFDLLKYFDLVVKSLRTGKDEPEMVTLKLKLEKKLESLMSEVQVAGMELGIGSDKKGE